MVRKEREVVGHRSLAACSRAHSSCVCLSPYCVAGPVRSTAVNGTDVACLVSRLLLWCAGEMENMKNN